MKKLTNKEIENRIVSKIICLIVKLEKSYEPRFVERACFRYKMSMANKRQAMEKKRILEKELAQIERRLI